MHTWRKSQPGDIESLQIQQWDKFGQAVQPLLSARLGELTYAYTLCYHDQPYAMVFGYLTSEGVCDLFMVSDVSVSRHAKWFFEHCNFLLATTTDVRRWQVHIDVGNERSCRMVEKMGFTREAILPGYYVTGPAYLYGRVM